jgi:subtilase family serine protease
MSACHTVGNRNRTDGSRLLPLLLSGMLSAGLLSATTVVPVPDRELHARADVIVHGIVVSSRVAEDSIGRPETVTVVAPLEVLKGRISGTLVLHQLGGQLPDGRFFKMWGRPEYEPGHEVIVFAIARAEGGYQTAELLLGKFDISRDELGGAFAVPALGAEGQPGVTVVRPRSKKDAIDGIGGEAGPDAASDPGAPRELEGFLSFLRRPDRLSFAGSVSPNGPLRPVLHSENGTLEIRPLWTNIGGLVRWNNGATAVFSLDGSANITGGGQGEANGAAAAWDDEPNSTINYSIGSGSSNLIHMNALSSPCGWSTCLSDSGVVGCGGPDGGGGTHSWRGETYSAITGGEAWLRSYCTFDLWDSVTTQAVLTHEMGHTLGLGHSDGSGSRHDVCRGDEDVAQMHSHVLRDGAVHYLGLGTDDADAARWLYGDGGNSCGKMPLTVTRAGTGSGTVASAPAGISCGSICSFYFAGGAVVALSASATSTSVFTGWSGDADCSDGSVTMDAGKSCTANFELRPDLAVTSLTAPSAALAGSAISIAETTKNQGGPAAASTTRYYLSANSTWEATDVPLGSRSVPALLAGASDSATFSLTIPANTATGGYYILARADADGQVAESNESNNTKAAVIHVGPPDLVVSSLAVPAAGGAGLTITVTDTTRDQTGTGPAGASLTRFYLSSDATLDASDVSLGSRNVPELAPGGSSSASTVLTIPPATASGTYFVVAKADADDATPESDETNNTRSATIAIGPDLVVSALSAPATGGAGLPITVTDTTKNQGAGSSGVSTTTRFYLSTDSTLGAGDVPLGSRTAGVLGPNGSSTAATALTIPAGTAAGSYYIVAKADDSAVVPETDDTNNTRSVLVRLSPDLIVNPITAASTAAAGSTISVTVTTKNQGLGSAIATKTRFYLSTNATFEAGVDVLIGTRNVPLLVSGASDSGSASLTIPPGTPPGGYYILARADADDAVSESNEANNTVSKPITISP